MLVLRLTTTRQWFNWYKVGSRHLGSVQLDENHYSKYLLQQSGILKGKSVQVTHQLPISQKVHMPGISPPQRNTYVDILCLFPFLFKTIGGPQTVHVVYLVCALDFLSLYRMGCGMNYRWAKPSSFLCFSQNAVHKIQLKHHHLHSAGQSLLSFHFFCTLHTMLPLHSPLRMYIFNIPISTDRQWTHWGQGWNLSPFSLLRAKYHRIHCGRALQLFNLLSTGRL